MSHDNYPQKARDNEKKELAKLREILYAARNKINSLHTAWYELENSRRGGDNDLEEIKTTIRTLTTELVHDFEIIKRDVEPKLTLPGDLFAFALIRQEVESSIELLDVL